MQRAWEMKNAYKIFAAKSTGKTRHRKSKHRYDIIKLDKKIIWVKWNEVDTFDSAQEPVRGF